MATAAAVVVGSVAASATSVTISTSSTPIATTAAIPRRVTTPGLRRRFGRSASAVAIAVVSRRLDRRESEADQEILARQRDLRVDGLDPRDAAEPGGG